MIQLPFHGQPQNASDGRPAELGDRYHTIIYQTALYWLRAASTMKLIKAEYTAD